MNQIIIAVIPLLDWTAITNAVACMRQAASQTVRHATGTRRGYRQGQRADGPQGAQHIPPMG